MKRKPHQHEFGFTAQSFNLASQVEKQSTPEPAKILAEMTPDERETVRWDSDTPKLDDIVQGERRCRHCASVIPKSQAYCDDSCRKKREAFEGNLKDHAARGMGLRHGVTQRDDFRRDSETTPGLAPGSYWSKADSGMVKALSTMQT